MRVRYIDSIAAAMLGLATLGGSPAGAMSADDAKSALAAGTPVILVMQRDVGELRKGMRYLVRFDPAGARMIVSAAASRKIESYAQTAADLTRDPHLWGARFAWSSDRDVACLTAPEATQTCAATFVGPLVPDRLAVPGDVVSTGATRLIQQLEQHLANPQAVIDRGGRCPKNPSLNQTHIAHRFLAEALRFNGEIVPFITEQKQRATADALVDQAVSLLLATAPTTARTTYTECYGGLDVITPFLIARALDAQYRLKPRPDVRAYLLRMWRQIIAEGVAETFGAQNARSSTRSANGFSAYLHLATIAESHGEKAFQPYTRRGIELLLQQQTSDNRSTCSDAKGVFAQTRGSWPHDTRDCSQNLGYHNFITGALIAVLERFSETGRCQGEERRLCGSIGASLDAALDWIVALDGGTGGLLDRSKGSSSIPSTPGSGDVAGAEAGFRIIAVRGDRNPRARAVLLAAMENAIRRRPNHLPIAAYLRANVFAPAPRAKSP